MPFYSYIARTELGAPAQGQIDAEGLEAARSALRGMNLSVEELHETTLSERSIGREPLRQQDRAYLPLLDTFRIYAGWLLALIIGAYALGAYQLSRALPFDIPLVEGLLLSPLLLQVAFAAFLFLFLSSVHRALRGGGLLGALLASLGIIIFVLYRMNVE